MNILSAPCSMFISKVDNHSIVKKKILDELSSKTVYGVYDKLLEIYNTDFMISDRYRAPYMDIAYQAVQQHLANVSKVLDCNLGINVSKIWHQQYKQGNFHGWHTHSGSMFSTVYYIQLDGQSPSTTFKHMGEEFDVRVEEGMVITFPSYLLHCSKPNQSNVTKTIVSFNCDLISQ